MVARDIGERFFSLLHTELFARRDWQRRTRSRVPMSKMHIPIDSQTVWPPSI